VSERPATRRAVLLRRIAFRRAIFDETTLRGIKR